MAQPDLKVVDAGTATRTYDCHADPQCEAPALHNSGPYAYLCETHKREKQERLLNERSQPGPKPLASGVPATYEGRAKELVSAGKKLDRALAKLKPVTLEAQEAKREWSAAMERLGS